MFLNEILDALVPICVCVVLPVSIVWIVMKSNQNKANRQAEIMLKAVEKGAELNPEIFSFGKRDNKTIKERLLEKFTAGTIVGGIGLAIMIILAVQSAGNSNAQLSDEHTSGLVIAGILLAIGIALLISYYVGRKELAKEIEAQEGSKTEK